ncbi:MAG TPA: hypothetical protein VD884_07985 [Ohtaekwangia sp.]|nr:hypothetical protein [Ohtaekwangia sp.]
MRPFYAVLTGVAILLAGAILVLANLSFIDKPSFFWETLVLLTFGTGLIFYYVYNTDQTTFTNFYLFTLVLKLLAYVVYCLIMIVMDPPGATANVVLFMIIYLVYTIIEIIFLYPRITR